MTPDISSRRPIFLAVLVVFAVLAAGCGSEASESAASDTAGVDPCNGITLANGFVRLPPAENSAAYFDITNSSSAEVTLTSAATTFGTTVELHETSMNDEGVMAMAEVGGGIGIPGGETVSLEPGGLHVMIMGVTESVAEGDMIDVDLSFDNGCSETTSLPVRAVDGLSTMDNDDMDHEDHDDMDHENMDHDDMEMGEEE